MRTFSGQKITSNELEPGLGVLTLASTDGELNKFNQETLSELHTALSFLENSELKGLLVTSDQPVFLAGGDINEFLARFQQSADKIQAEINSYNQALNRLEDLPFPTLCVINGAALGGGIEIALACDYRLAVCDAKLGSPEVSLGLIPGTGATVRLPRVCGIENALHWIGDGDVIHADQCNIGLIDEICFNQQELMTRSVEKLREVINTPQEWQQRRQRKKQAIGNPPPTGVYQQARDRLRSLYGEDPSFSARLAAVDTMAKSAGSKQDIALAVEALHLIELSQTENCRELIRAFLVANHKSADTPPKDQDIKPERQHFSGSA